MPTYKFLDTQTGDVFEKFMKISELDDFKKTHPHYESVMTAPNIVGGVGASGPKTDDGFKEVMSKIAEKHPGSSLANEYGRKSINTVKTEQVLKTHRDKNKK